MPLPKPNKGEMQHEFIARCVKFVKDDNGSVADDQASAMCFHAWNSRFESLHPADADFSEASSDAAWGDVDKSKLPAACFLWVEDPDKKSTWHLPVYMGAGGIDSKSGMYRRRGPVNLGALRAASSAIAGGRTGKPMSVPASVKAKLHALLKAHNIGQEGDYSFYRTPHLAESGDRPSHLVETITFEGAEFIADPKQKVVKNVVMLGPISSHGYEYKQEAMAQAVASKLYEGCRIFINHTEKGGSRDVMALAGIFKNTRHERGKVKGDAYLLPDQYGTKFFNIASTMPEAAGCSHVADGKLVKTEGKQYVEAITKVHSVDLVVQGATTSNVFEGVTPAGDQSMNLTEAKLEDVRATRPDLVHQLVLEGATTRDEEVQALISEKETLASEKAALLKEKETLTQANGTLTEAKNQLQAKLDESAVLEATRQKEAVVAKCCAELPEQAVTVLFKEQCLNVKTGTPFDLKVFEAKVMELVKDRKTLCEQTGVHGMGGERLSVGGTRINEAEADRALTLS